MLPKSPSVALIDGDIIRYEIGFAAETGWKAITEEREFVPPWDYVADMFHNRINWIVAETGVEDFTLYLTESGPLFRDSIATEKPYKGTRDSLAKPFYFKSLSVYMQSLPQTQIANPGMEADDIMSIRQVMNNDDTIICSRDKDLRQVPGWTYSWELGKQASFGPLFVENPGHIELDRSSSTIKVQGYGYKFFAAQCLMGDVVDNIPGLPKCGPVKAHDLLSELESDESITETLVKAYKDHYGEDEWEAKLLEQGRLLWMTRELDKNGNPILWEIGMT